ncbi:C-terminal helicase domain-containing protein [Micropruina sp.]|uniref:C-terminal helicase domain-containing protein n=1 Tax=Micropruina sp. TaxID=2737536 RepID=UPI0039E513E6
MRLQNLGYAITAHRAQGVTTDTAHVITTVTTTRENFYVAMTRGADGNYAYVVLDRPDDGHGVPHPSDNPDTTERSVLYGVIQHIGAELSAHETITAEQERWSNIGQLAAEYETIAQAAQHDRWATLFAAAGLTGEQVDAVLDSDAYPALSAELRHAEANYHDLDILLPRLVAARGLDDAADVASVIHARVARATSRPAGSGRTRKPPRLIAGLIPYADGPMADDMRQALDERHELIEARAEAILTGALADKAPWTARLGPEPKVLNQRKAWRRAAAVVAAYRDRYQITDDRTPLGPPPQNTRQKIDRARAEAALRELSAGAPSQETGHRVTRAATRGPRL